MKRNIVELIRALENGNDDTLLNLSLKQLLESAREAQQSQSTWSVGRR